jgi:hypothetical protein
VLLCVRMLSYVEELKSVVVKMFVTKYKTL